MRVPTVGEVVTYHDAVGKPHAALVTCVFEGSFAAGNSCINLVFVSGDEKRQDEYGRQIERQTSIVHKEEQGAHGMYWRWPHETPNPVVEPTSR